MIDMKNAQAPGAYRAYAHDYRADLARFVSAVFGMPASDDQMARIESAARCPHRRDRMQTARRRPVMELWRPRSPNDRRVSM
jgi:hypothetical protein